MIAAAEFLLSKQGVDVNAKNKAGLTPLQLVACGGSVNVAKFLVSMGADTKVKNMNGASLLDLAVHGKNAAMVQYLSGGNAPAQPIAIPNTSVQDVVNGCLGLIGFAVCLYLFLQFVFSFF